jgi:hypothetical protein
MAAKPRCGFCDQPAAPATKESSVSVAGRERKGYFVFCSNCEAVMAWVPNDPVEVTTSLLPARAAAGKRPRRPPTTAPAPHAMKRRGKRRGS